MTSTPTRRCGQQPSAERSGTQGKAVDRFPAPCRVSGTDTPWEVTGLPPVIGWTPGAHAS